MSNWASVVVTWSSVAGPHLLPTSAYRKWFTDKIYAVQAEASRPGTIQYCWGCDGEDTPSCCENIARLPVNHFFPDDFREALRLHAGPMMHRDFELDVWYKTEDMDRYERLDGILYGPERKPV